jgi:hypothetical protein
MTATTQTAPAFNRSFEGFLSFLHDRDVGAAVISPKRFSEVLSMDLQTLAAQAHVHRNTINRAPASEGVQRFLREAVRAIRAAADRSGDLDRALFWYRNEPLQPFGYKTAEHLVSEGRIEDLLRYIASLEAGAAG